MSDYHGRAISLTGKLALDADGSFLAIRWDDRADLGAYAAAFGAFIATRNLTVTIGGVYRIPAMYARTRLAYTNATPVSAYRGAGRPDIAYAIERLVDYAAHEHGFDPIELRRKNFVPREAMAPAKTPRPLIQKLHAEIVAIANTADAREVFASQGNDVVANTPEEFARVIRREAIKWGDIGRKLGVALD